MHSKFTRALLVIAVFALLAILAATGSYLVGEQEPLPPGKIKPFAILWWANFRYYLAWALVTPLVLWLGRRVPFARGRWRGPLAFHLLVPIVFSYPFFAFRMILGGLLLGQVPPFQKIALVWQRIVLMEPVTVIPIYGLLIAAGIVVQFYGDYEAKQLQAVELQRSLATAQLDALRMKLQPHFLFNTLNAIGTLAREGNTADVSRVVEHLGTLLRLSMDTSGRQFVTLDEELALLDEYLAIEEVRFDEQLRVVRHVDPRAGSILVPNVILQPLVENALVHGLAGRIGAGLLELTARIEGSSLCLSVRDDGPGLPPGWSSGSRAGRGLRNVMDRMQALYDGAGRVELHNAPGGGALASLWMPVVVSDARDRREQA